jgi:hypothetical protein
MNFSVIKNFSVEKNDPIYDYQTTFLYVFLLTHLKNDANLSYQFCTIDRIKFGNIYVYL